MARIGALTSAGTNRVAGTIEFRGTRFTAPGWLAPADLTTPTVWLLNGCRAASAPLTNGITMRGELIVE